MDYRELRERIADGLMLRQFATSTVIRSPSTMRSAVASID